MAAKKKDEKNINLGQGTGRRKTAVARVYLREGDGKITINGRPAEEYFDDPTNIFMLKQPLDVTDNTNKFDLVINVYGGGNTGQAGACRHGIARALVAYNEDNKPALQANGFMTRDSRMVERKKFGQPGARKKFQFSKR
ncbi:MAG: 30S ribosomal protein S9 [Sphaerochaetaceae bacterium]|nr:30S ribosomal protein S9 [Sphaerochaetaceae bacterium]HHU88761.1 30S ribosomal protein S9 [Spirochaetales bacterium]